MGFILLPLSLVESKNYCLCPTRIRRRDLTPEKETG
jgi:hypothetical protein